jgi:nitrite reductase/ring-hydroxylating ferredoxin subunit
LRTASKHVDTESSRLDRGVQGTFSEEQFEQRIADGYFATADLCTHGAACLSEGDIENDEIVCPFHGGTFDIKTGEATAAPCVIPVETYAVVVDGDIVYIEQ